MLATRASLRDTHRVDDEGLDSIIEQIKELIHGGAVRRIVVKDSSGATVIEAPLTVGMVGLLLLPLWAALAAAVALLADATIVVERHEGDASAHPDQASRHR